MATKSDTTDRYCIAKDGKHSNGKPSWGVYDNDRKTFVEGEFFSKDAARRVAGEMNAVAR